MQSATTVFLICLVLIVALPIRAAERLMCTASFEDQDEGVISSLFANQQPLFASPAEYRQWLGQCLLPPAQFEKIRRSYVVIDSRDPASYARDHLKGSINVPLSSIKTHLFLKGKNILLLGHAHDRVAMIDSCKKLRSAEFANVRVLQGGYAALASETRSDPVSFSARSALELPTSKLIFESRYDPWVVIDLSSQGARNLDDYFTNIYRLNAYPTLEQMDEIVNSANLSTAIGASSRFIVIDRDGNNVRRFEQWLQDIEAGHGYERKYYLQGGAEAFNDYSKKLKIMLSKRDFVLNPRQGCGG